MTAPTIERAIRAACNAFERASPFFSCLYPNCACTKIPRAVQAALEAAKTGESDERE